MLYYFLIIPIIIFIPLFLLKLINLYLFFEDAEQADGGLAILLYFVLWPILIIFRGFIFIIGICSFIGELQAFFSFRDKDLVQELSKILDEFRKYRIYVSEEKINYYKASAIDHKKFEVFRFIYHGQKKIETEINRIKEDQEKKSIEQKRDEELKDKVERFNKLKQ